MKRGFLWGLVVVLLLAATAGYRQIERLEVGGGYGSSGSKFDDQGNGFFDGNVTVDGSISGGSVVLGLDGLTDVTLTGPGAGGDVLILGFGQYRNVPVSGDATIVSTGALTVAPNAIGTNKIAPDTILAEDIAIGAVGTAEILDGTILAEDIADGAVTGAEIAPNTITAADIATDAIGALELANDSVASANIIDATIVAGDLSGADTDVTWSLGKGKLSSAVGADWMTLSHYDFAISASYALTQGPFGQTAVNSASGQRTLFNINNVTMADVGFDGINLSPGKRLQIDNVDITTTAGQIAANRVDSAAISLDTIVAQDIATGAVGALELANDSVASANIIADTILAVDIATGAVSTTEILDGTVFTSDIALDTILAEDIASGAVGTSEILDETILTSDIATDTILAVDIATGAVATTEILNDTILAADIATDAVGALELANNSVGSANILIDSIVADDIATGAVGTAEIATDAIGALELANDSVASANIIADTILAVDIAVGAVGTAEILDSTIAPADIGSQDTDTKFVLGRANIGSWSGGTDQAYFGHKDFDTATGYALRQDNTGNVFLNAADTKTISFRQNNLEKANIGPFGFNIASGMTYIHNGVVVIGTDGIIVEAALPRWEHTWWYNEMYESPTVHGGADAYIGANGFTNRIGLKIASGSATPARVSVVVPDNYRDPGAGDIQVRMIVGHAAIAAAATVSWQVVTAADNADWGAPGTYSTWTTGTASGFYDSGWVNLTAASGGAIVADEILTVYFKQTNSSAATVYVYNVMIRGGA